MRQKRYGVKGEYDGHKKAHDEFLDKLGGLRAPVDAGSVNFAKNWSANCILFTVYLNVANILFTFNLLLMFFLRGRFFSFS